MSLPPAFARLRELERLRHTKEWGLSFSEAHEYNGLCLTRAPRLLDALEIAVEALNALLQMRAEQALPILRQVIERRDPGSECLRRQAMFLVSQKRSPETASILLVAARTGRRSARWDATAEPRLWPYATIRFGSIPGSRAA